MSGKKARPRKGKSEASNQSAMMLAFLTFIGALVGWVVLNAAVIPGVASLDMPWTAVLGVGLGIELVGMVLIAWMLWGQKKFWKNFSAAAVIFAVGATILAFAILRSVNRLFDSSAAQSTQGTAVYTSSSKRGDSTRIKLPGPPRTETVTISGRYSRGEQVTVEIRQGFFGWRWIARVR